VLIAYQSTGSAKPFVFAAPAEEKKPLPCSWLQDEPVIGGEASTGRFGTDPHHRYKGSRTV
jgi:hypothetical protein